MVEHFKVLYYFYSEHPTQSISLERDGRARGMGDEKLPDYIRKAPWYVAGTGSGGLEHQRAPQNRSRDDYSRDAQEILEAGIRSAKLGEQVKLPL